MKRKNLTGYVLWTGPSRLNPSREVAAIVTLKSKNRKVGKIPQVWILDTGEAPNVAYKLGGDAFRAMCGDCKHGGAAVKSCYVSWGKAPLSVWRKYHRGGYDRAPLSVWRKLRSVGVRMGAAGDPAALPLAITRILRPATAYTHQWNKAEHQGLARWAMASVDTPEEKEMSRKLGWRAFQVILPQDPRPKDSIICPTEYREIQCQDCRLCSGTSRAAKSIQIPVHGPTATNYTRWRLPVVR